MTVLAKVLGRGDRPQRLHMGYGSWIAEMFSGRSSAAGVKVSETTALSLSAVFAACNVLSGILASLPLVVYRKNGREKTEAETHPAHWLLSHEFNSEMTSVLARRVLEFHRLLWGKCYAEIQWAGNGTAAALWPIEPWRVKVERDKAGALTYLIDQQRAVHPRDMLFVPLISFDGISGRSFVEFATESLGLGLAAQEFAARWFGNGAKPGGILKHPATPSPESRSQMRQAWDAVHGGPQKSGRTAVVWGGWDYTENAAFDAEKSQMMEQRRFGVEEVARWLNVPLNFIRDMANYKYTNIEQESIDFIRVSLGPVMALYEQEYDRKLLQPPSLYCKHQTRALMRGDAAARSAYYRELWGIGVFSINDILDLEELNPVDGGDAHFVPVNMQPLEAALTRAEQGEGPEPTPDDEGDGAETAPTPPDDSPSSSGGDTDGPSDGPPDPPMPAMRALLEHTLVRMARVEANALKRLSDRPKELFSWMDGFYPEHEARIVESLGPVLAVCRPGRDAQSVARGWCERSRESLLADAETPPAGWTRAVESRAAHLIARAAIEAGALMEN